MSPNSKFKNNDEILSMYLVPKKMYNALLNQLDEDEETKNELIAMNQNQINNNNYIENAIAFKKQQSDQKRNTSTSNVQKPDITDNQSAVTPNTLSRSVSTFRPLQLSAQSETFPTNVSSNITLPDNQIDSQQKKESIKKSATNRTSTPVRRTYSQKYYRNSPILQALHNRNPAGKLVCPIQICKKQYVSKDKLAAHLLKEHYNDLAIREKRALSEASRSLNTSNNTPLSSIPEDTPVLPRNSNNSSRNTGARKNLFPSKYPKL